MAKINHNNYYDTINDVAANAKKRKALYLEAYQTNHFPYSLNIESKNLIPFNSNGYMALEHHPLLVNKTLEIVKKYGTQFSISRAFIDTDIILELEAKLRLIFQGRPLITYTSTTLAHTSIFPSLIRKNDLIILDQQVHFSVQTAAQIVAHTGVKTIMVRHNNMEMLERFIKSNYNKYDKIWYLVDGVYSMFGDVPNTDALDKLLTKYPKLFLYADDAHGVGWTGSLGTGFIFDKLLHQPNFILCTTMCKGFGAQGGIVIFPTEEMKEQVRGFGGPLAYSHPLQPPIIGAALGATDFFLSNELSQRQEDMEEKMDYFQSELEASELPIISYPRTPIFYIGMGKPRTTFNMIRKLMNDGFIISAGVFPAVPMKCCGLRMSLSHARTKEEISGLVDAVKKNYPIVLEEENVKYSDIQRAFGIKENVSLEAYLSNDSLLQFNVEIYDDITRIPKDAWNEVMADKGIFDYDGLIDQQKLFSDNNVEHQNYDFYYLLVTDHRTGEIIVATFLTSGLMKDDLLDPAEISSAIEIRRKEDPLYLTSSHLMLGSPISEGDHLYIKRNNTEWKKAVILALDQIKKLNLKLEANNLLIRDIPSDDNELKDIFINEGFLPVRLPNANITKMVWKDFSEYLESITSKKRKLLNLEALEFRDRYDVKIVTEPSAEQSALYYELYNNIQSKNLDLNLFSYPEKIFQTLSGQNWEYIELYLKPDLNGEYLEKPVAMGCCYRYNESYITLLAGLNYDYVKSHGLYKQLLYRVMERAFTIGASKIYFGLSADEAKRKFGAVAEPKIAFSQITDMYNREVISTISAAAKV